MEGAGEKGLLENCPRCAYLLRGLPVRHACPECGLEFDRRWQVFGRRALPRSAVRTLRLVAGGGFTVVMVASFVAPLLMGQVAAAVARSGWGWLVIITALLPLGVALYFVVALRRRPAFIGVGPAGVFIYRGPQSIERYVWCDIGRVQLAQYAPAVVVPVGGKKIELRLAAFFAGVGGGIAEAERLIRYINHYPRE